MPLAITLRMDADSGATVAALIARLATAGIARDQVDLGYPPHMTLAVWRDDNPAATRPSLTVLAANTPAITCMLAAVAVFPGPPAVMWLAPSGSVALLGLHDRVANAAPATDLHYRPGNWVPHVTLSTSIQDPGAALAALQPLPLPIEARFLAAWNWCRFRR
jgi:2'-5' RNA ligase